MTDTIGTYYYQPERPTPADLLTNPPYQTGRDYDAACGSGAWIVEATKRITEPASRDAGE